MSTHEVYCSFDISKLLKKAGFDWECLQCWVVDYTSTTLDTRCTAAWDWNGITKNYSAPTLDVAQRWLREVKHVEVLIEVKYLPHTVYYARVEYEKYGYVLGTHPTYEESQETGIKKALEIILEKEK